MNKRGIIVLVAVAFVALLFVFDSNRITGYMIKYDAEDLKRTSDKTEIFFYQNPVQRATTLNVRIIPGVKGIEKSIELYKVTESGEKFIKSYKFCPQHVCTRARIYPLFISKAYRPGTYVLVVYDKVYGSIKGYVKIK